MDSVVFRKVGHAPLFAIFPRRNEQAAGELRSILHLDRSLVEEGGPCRGSGFYMSTVSPFENFRSMEMIGALNLSRFRNCENGETSRRAVESVLDAVLPAVPE